MNGVLLGMGLVLAFGLLCIGIQKLAASLPLDVANPEEDGEFHFGPGGTV